MFSKGQPSRAQRGYLFLTVFVAGMTTLAVEFTVGRMLQTVYGTSNVVWANVIGLVLLFLTVGYFMGGRWADRHPLPHRFYLLVSLAGFCTVFFLLLTSVLLRAAAGAMASVNVGAILGSLAAVALTLALPVTLLGCLSPFAIRLAVRDVDEAGRMSGRIYAISTWGSLLGTYLPVLVVIPQAGSRWSALIFGGSLLLVGLGGLWQNRASAGPCLTLVGLLLPALLVPPTLTWLTGPIKEYPGQLYEKESAYNYVQVIRQEDCNYLLLNEGQAFHSFYCDGGRVTRISVWSIMLAAPYFNDPADLNDQPAVRRMAVIGLAAGTIPKQYSQVFGPIPIDGIELDPVVAEAGRNYFDLHEPNVHVIIGDGRYEFNRLSGPYDVVTIDAYKVPYIPWHLTTQEFFGQVKARLSERGVVAVNVGRAPADRRLVDAITATLLAVFPTVHALDVPGSLNTILVATVRPTAGDNLLTNLNHLPPDSHELLFRTLRVAADNVVPTVASDVVFTDERAPVETIVDSLVIRYLLREGPAGLPGLGGD
ncbi:MAG: fused MFS/spermidine synthase [Chloroflexota bacterium]